MPPVVSGTLLWTRFSQVPNPLFSTYRTGENRVTSSTMAVFERVDLELVRELLAEASGAGSELMAVTFTNQVTGSDSVPDARISGRFTWWFETKTEANAYVREGHGRAQLRAHAQRLDDPDAVLFVLTPDPVRPVWLDQLDGIDESVRPRVLWIGFRDLRDAVTRLISDPTRILGEQTRFLLAELIALYESDGLLSFDDTVIVAARAAWPEYLQRGVYVCQPNRSFKSGLTHLGFYAEGAIQPLIAALHRHVVAVPFTPSEAAERRAAADDDVADVIDVLLADGSRTEDELYDILLVSGPEAPETVRLDHAIANDTVAASGRPWAWTLGQRYTRLQALRSGARSTSQLA